MKPNQLTAHSRWAKVLPPLLFLLLAFLLFANTFGNGWTFDDFAVIVHNPDVHSVAGFFRNANSGRPLREISYMVDYGLFGFRPAGYHLQNILWHALNAWLVFLLVGRLGGRRAVAWIASLLFLCHPIVVEVVAATGHRKDSMALAFCLLTFMAYTKAFESWEKRAKWLVISFALLVTAYFAKNTTTATPVVLLGYELAYVPSKERFLLKRKWLTFLVIAVLVLILLGLFFALGGGGKYEEMRQARLVKQNHFEPATFGMYYRTIFKSIPFLFTKLVWPFRLALEYTYPLPASWLDPWVLAGLAGIAIYLTLLRLFFRRNHLAFIALLWAGVMWIPVSNLVWPVSYFSADRYLYAPLVGFATLFALLVDRLLSRKPKIEAAVVFGLLVFLSMLTLKQNRVWATSETLWKQAVEVSPRAPFALNNLGDVYAKRRDVKKAYKYFLRSAKANPHNAPTQFNLGWAYERMGDHRKSLFHYRRFLKLDDPKHREEAERLRRYLKRKYGAAALQGLKGPRVQGTK